MTLARWGFVPASAKSLTSVKKLSSTRDDRLATSPMWKGLLRCSWCLVLASSFIEITGVKGARTPVHIGLVSGGSFVMGGLWLRWKRGGRVLESFMVVTTRPNAVVEVWHDRMSVIVKPRDRAGWLEQADYNDLSETSCASALGG